MSQSYTSHTWWQIEQGFSSILMGSFLIVLLTYSLRLYIHCTYSTPYTCVCVCVILYYSVLFLWMRKRKFSEKNQSLWGLQGPTKEIGIVGLFNHC